MNRLQNRRNKKRFTELLEEFVCRKNCDLQNALNLISKTGSRKYKTVTLAAQNLYDSLRHGNTFSSALKNCSAIEFDVLYVSFISFAERCGSLEQTLIFLKDKCLREEENNSKSSSVLPTRRSRRPNTCPRTRSKFIIPKRISVSGCSSTCIRARTSLKNCKRSITTDI